MKRVLIAVVLCGGLIYLPAADADIIWDYTSTNGVQTVTGQLVTTGNLGDAFTISNSFSLLEITNIALNSVPVVDWLVSGGGAPPFSSSLLGSIIVDSPGHALIDPSGGNIVGARAVGDSNLIWLARPGAFQDTRARWDSASQYLFAFQPTETSFSNPSAPGAIPEPGTCAALSAVLLIGAALGRRRKSA